MLASTKIVSDLEELWDVLELEEDMKKFKFLWISAVSMCRSVGQILHKVDASKSDNHKYLINKQWDSIKNNYEENKIFHEFIKFERDMILKEYQLGYDYGDFTVVIGDSALGVLGEGLYCPMTYGYYENEDCRDVLKLAIKWWQSKLTEIEDAL